MKGWYVPYKAQHVRESNYFFVYNPFLPPFLTRYKHSCAPPRAASDGFPLVWAQLGGSHGLLLCFTSKRKHAEASLQLTRLLSYPATLPVFLCVNLSRVGLSSQAV